MNTSTSNDYFCTLLPLVGITRCGYLFDVFFLSFYKKKVNLQISLHWSWLLFFFSLDFIAISLDGTSHCVNIKFDFLRFFTLCRIFDVKCVSFGIVPTTNVIVSLWRKFSKNKKKFSQSRQCNQSNLHSSLVPWLWPTEIVSLAWNRTASATD